jgi:glycosyltransferase involved in cell wall biosynthesis
MNRVGSPTNAVSLVVRGGANPNGKGYQRRAAQIFESLTNAGITVHVVAGSRRSFAGTVLAAMSNLRLPFSILVSQSFWDFTPRPGTYPIFVMDRTVPKDFAGRFAVDFVDSLADSYGTRSRVSANPFAALFWRFEAQRVRRYDGSLVSRADKSFAITERDAQSLGQNTRVIPMWSRPATEPLRPGAESSVCFVGLLGYPPNREAALWVDHDLQPVLSGIRVRILGRGRARLTRRISAYEGSYGTIGEVLDSQSISIAPVVFGAGLQTKVLESAAHGVPIVVSPFVAAGLIAPLPDGIVVAEREPSAMASVLQSLFPVSVDRAGLRSWVEMNYGTAVVSRAWEQEFEDRLHFDRTKPMGASKTGAPVHVGLGNTSTRTEAT